MENNALNVLVVLDEDGVMRPMAGIWIDNPAGHMGADDFLSKQKNTKNGERITKATLLKNE